MTIKILMPALSPTMTEGNLSKWLVKKGDKINAGDVIAEIETDKATMELEAVDEGMITDILVKEGSEGIAVNTPIAILNGSENEKTDHIQDENKTIQEEDVEVEDSEELTEEEIAAIEEEMEAKLQASPPPFHPCSHADCLAVPHPSQCSSSNSTTSRKWRLQPLRTRARRRASPTSLSTRSLRCLRVRLD